MHVVQNKIDAAEDNDVLYDQLTIQLHPSDTVIHKYFGEETAVKIIQYASHKATMFFIGILLVSVTIFWQMVSTEERNHGFLTTLAWMIVWPIAIAYLFILLCCVNRHIAIQIMTTFEFWFKMYYVFAQNVASGIYWYYVRKDDYSYVKLRSIAHSFEFMGIGLFLTILFMMEGFHFNGTIMICTTAFVAVYYGWNSIYFEFLWNPDGDQNSDDSIIKIGSSIQFSLLSIMATGYRIVSIFLFKQCFMLIYHRKRKGKRKSMFIRIAPYLEWVYVGVKNTNNANDSDVEYNAHAGPSETELDLMVANAYTKDRPCSFSIPTPRGLNIEDYECCSQDIPQFPFCWFLCVLCGLLHLFLIRLVGIVRYNVLLKKKK
eukprot:520397_1